VDSPGNKVNPVIGSFEHAELVRLKQIAKLKPYERVKMICSMQAIVSRANRSRKKN
jgi:hypothetical protein